MKQKLMLLQFLLVIFWNIASLRAECNACYDVNQMACVSGTTYQFCVDNVPTGNINTCPAGYVCSTTTNSPVICQSTATGAVATCNECNKCDANLVFACTGVNTYALCFGQTTPSAVVASCGTGRVCNINSQNICESSATSSPTCPTGDTTSSTSTTTTTRITTSTTPVSTQTLPTTVPTYAQYYCSVMRMNRRFAAPKQYDYMCKRYIYCFRTTTGSWSGQIYTCTGSTYFDPTSLYCVATRPSNC